MNRIRGRNCWRSWDGSVPVLARNRAGDTMNLNGFKGSKNNDGAGPSSPCRDCQCAEMLGHWGVEGQHKATVLPWLRIPQANSSLALMARNWPEGGKDSPYALSPSK